MDQMSLASKYIAWANPAQETFKDKSKHHLLVVDDDLAIRAILQNILRKDFRITTAGSGYEALAWLANGNRPDLIVSDITMPGINGFGLLKALSQSGLHNSIPVIVLSGHCKEEIGAHAIMYNNLKACLSKPFDPTLLKKRINTVLEAELQLC